MRFLCLHGRGTNSKIFQYQTAALRYQLGEGHDYDFVEASIPCDPAPGMQELGTLSEECFSYFDESSLASCRQMIEDFDAYITAEGPFDGVIAFSEGAVVASALMIYKTIMEPEQQRIAPIFKCAVFFCGGAPGDPAAYLQGELRVIDCTAHAGIIKIPTAHIWGANDKEKPDFGQPLSMLCDAELRSVFVHGGGHEIPGSKDPDKLRSAVRCIRRTIDRVI